MIQAMLVLRQSPWRSAKALNCFRKWLDQFVPLSTSLQLSGRREIRPRDGSLSKQNVTVWASRFKMGAWDSTSLQGTNQDFTAKVDSIGLSKIHLKKKIFFHCIWMTIQTPMHGLEGITSRLQLHQLRLVSPPSCSPPSNHNSILFVLFCFIF